MWKTVLPLSFVYLILMSLPLFSQDKLYPVRPGADVPVLLNADHSAYVIERAFRHKLTLGFPTDDQMWFFPKSGSPLAVFWLRIQNVSKQPLDLDIAKFTGMDEEGKYYMSLPFDDAFKRIMEGVSNKSIGSIGSKTLRGITLGRAAGKPTEEDIREDAVRYTLRSGQIPPSGVREGLIYFEAPRRKKYTMRVGLGDLWSTPLLFSTQKLK